MKFDPIFGEANEVIAYLDERGDEWTPAEVEEYWDVTGNYPTTKKEASMAYEEMARECSALMDEIEKSAYTGSSEDGDPRMARISELASLLSWFAPELLDKRFGF